MGMEVLIIVILGHPLLFLIDFFIGLSRMATKLWLECLLSVVDPVVNKKKKMALTTV